MKYLEAIAESAFLLFVVSACCVADFIVAVGLFWRS